MTVTFRPSNIQYVTVSVACGVCDGTGKDGEYDCHYCSGTGAYNEVEPAEGFVELNISNMNASMLLGVIMPEFAFDDLCGEFKGTLLDRMYARCMQLLNGDISRITRETEVIGNLTFLGVCDERARNYLVRLLEMAKKARADSASIIFS